MATEIQTTHETGGATPAPPSPFPVRDTLAGKNLLVTGATGFLGKVLVSMLLYQVPEIGRIFLLIRPRKHETADERLTNELIDSPAFNHLRDRYSDGLANWVRDRVEVVPGDVTEPDFGLSEDAANALGAQIDIIVNSAGLTDFNPPLDQAIGINTIGAKHAAEFALRTRANRLLHISTCYVAGCRDGKIEETELPYGWIPDESLDLDDFRVHDEITDCQRLIDDIERRADDQHQRVEFRTKARERLTKRNRDHSDPSVLADGVKDERRRWVSRMMRDEGLARAKHWGWPNIYTYSKSLGEQILTKYESNIKLSIVRPAIVESAEAYPMAGWNEGINTCAPLTFLAGEFVRYYPTHHDVRLDVVPVDAICRGVILATVALLREEHELIYQLSSSHRNPISMHRITELSTLWHRRKVRNKVGGSKLTKLILQNSDTQPASKLRYDWLGMPAIRKTAGGVANLLEAVKSRPGSPLGRAATKLAGRARGVEKAALTVERVIEIFMPFIHDRRYIFKAGHIKALEDRLTADEFRDFAFDIEKLDWRHYWLEIQMPGLNRWVYPKLRDKLNAERAVPHTYDDILEMLDAAARNHADRPALQHVHDDHIERYTYADLHTFAERAANRLVTLGMKAGDRVMLMSENRPQWGMTYLAVLKTGGACVPVDPELPVADLWNLIESAAPFALVTSAEVRARIGEELEGSESSLASRPELRHIDLRMLLSDDVALALPGDAVEPAEIEVAPTDSMALPQVSTTSVPAIVDLKGDSLATTREQTERIASLIFTSGTTGKPKGVMLTHKNFTSLLQALHRTFKVDETDGFLSVLPLHHTFEFASGFLLPLSRGATVTYIEELNAESLERAFESTPITVMIGVPALWQVFHRRIMSGVRSRGPAGRLAFDTLTGTNRFLRKSIGVNVGPVLFKQVFDRFGGKIRYFISGGASLPPSVFNTFYGLGFSLLEGYGLTETSPVLTVNRPGDMRAGSVGKALPCVEIDLVDPDGDGVGEIRARGPNVMLGYYEDEERTNAVLRDGWFYTGDLGRLDRKGRLYIVGRQKDVIVSSSGKNVYPDELEDLFGKIDDIDEIGVVGLSDKPGSERVAALIRTTTEDDDTDETRLERQREIRHAIEVRNSQLPFHQRIKLVRFTDEDLPRTATRKVKRDLVRARIMELDSTRPTKGHVHDPQSAWLFELLASIGSSDAEVISLDDQLIADLGFDSLMLTELSTRIEDRASISLDMEGMSSTATVREILAACGDDLVAGAEVEDAEIIDEKAARRSRLPARYLPSLPQDEEGQLLPSLRLFRRDRDGEIEIPSLVAEGGSKALDWAQKALYQKGFNVKVIGRANIPHNRPVIVVSNHSSHLDMGLVKYALWDFAPDLSALAAADYFFSTPGRRAYFNNFTNLIPVERSGSLEDSLANASEALESGRRLIIFPEGTRSTSGDLQPFRRGLGYLAVRHKADILPVFIRGTHRSLPKGKVLPRGRRLEVNIGEPITTELQQRLITDMARGDAYRLVSDLARDGILALKAGRRFLDAYEGDEVQAVETGNPMLRECIDFLEGRFVADTVDQKVSYYFSLEDSDDGRWNLTLTPESATFGRGKPSGGRADCVLKCTPDMFRRIVKEHYTPAFDEFMNGTVKTNAPDLLMKFQAAFSL